DVAADGRVKLFRELYGVGGYKLQIRNPDFFDRLYYSNNYIWDNNLNKETRGVLSYGIEWGKGNGLSVSNYSFTNYTYYDSLVNPIQADKVLKATRIALCQNFTFWKFIHFDNTIYYQTTTDERKILLLPEWVS